MAATADDPLLAALPDAAAATGTPSIAVRIADALPWLLLPPGMICKYAEKPLLAPVPNVKRWFLGVAVDRGVMTPVFDLARWLDDERSTAATGIVVFSDRQHTVGFASIEPPRVVATAAHADEVAEHMLPAAMRDCIGGTHLGEIGTCFTFLPFDWLRRNAQRVSAHA